MTLHGLHVLYPDTQFPTVPVKALRLWDCGVHWGAIHTAPGVFDWARLDALVAQAQAHGVTDLTYVAAGTPAWLSRDPQRPGAAPWVGAGSNMPPSDMAHWGAFITALASRYRGRIGAVQVWNEPQLRMFWDFAFQPLAEMTRRAHVIISSVAPGMLTVSAPVLPRPSSGGMVKGGLYLKALAGKGWPVDVHAAHLYPEVGRNATRLDELVRLWRTGLRAHRAPNLPMWVTEVNGNLTGGAMPAARQGAWITHMDELADAAGIRRVYWYAWGQHTDPALFGIPFTPDSPAAIALTRVL